MFFYKEVQWISVSSGEEKKKKSVEEKDGDVSQDSRSPWPTRFFTHKPSESDKT